MSTNSSNNETPRQTVVALFASRSDADQGMTRLLSVGFLPEHIGMLEPADEPKDPARGGSVAIVVGALSGAIIGGVTGTMVLGLASVGWALVAALTGIAFGAYAGAVVGSFFGYDGANGDEPYFVRAIQDGRILVSAEVPDHHGETTAVAVLYDSHALEVDSLGTGRLRLRLRHPPLTEEVA